MASCIAGNESEIKVENDTFNGLAYARALAGFAEMLRAFDQSDKPYARLAEKLYLGLQTNYQDKVLLPFRGAKYLTGLQYDFFLMNLPDGIDAKSIDAAFKVIQTPWGLDSDQPSEAYRDWPWWHPRVAISMAHLGRSKKSFRWLCSSMQNATSLGMLPEKVRMDGFAIGYGYTSPHALLVWAAVEALCHDGTNNSIRLLWGLDGKWQDTGFENIRLCRGSSCFRKSPKRKTG